MLDKLNWKTESGADYRARMKLLKEIHLPKKKVSRYKNPLPQALLDRHPDLKEKDIRLIRKMILLSYSRRVRNPQILDFTIPHLGRWRTHGNRVKAYANPTRKADKKRKRTEARKKEFDIKNLLW